jgi:alpha-amylase/alpha-mannosidase (GH57 family)
MLWLNFLHLYQPANIDSSHIKEALDKSYSRLVRLLEENNNLKLTFNISGCLLERLEAMGETNFRERIKKLLDSGRLELTGSAAYHAFLPSLPENEVIRQIKENEAILQKFFGSDFKSPGFFLPEMAYTPALGKLIKALGYTWLVLDELTCAGNVCGQNKPYRDEASDLKIIFRNRALSQSYPPDEIIKLLKEPNNQERILISTTDAELYGLRHEDPTAELESIARAENLQTQTFSEFIDGFAASDLLPVKLRSASWESSEAEIASGEPFKLWQNKKNKIHSHLWRLSYLALSLGEKYSGDANFYWYRWHLVRGLASCTFWWASAKDFSENFGPYAWSPDMVESGLGDLVRAVRAIANPESRKEKLLAENYYLKIKKYLWREHWQKHWPEQTKD